MNKVTKPLLCGFKGCGKPAVCGLIHEASGFAINVCRDCFQKVKGYPVEEDEQAKRLGIQTELFPHSARK